MNDAELYGRTIRVNFARPPKVTERSSRPVWADDEWLKQYGHGAGEGIATEQTNEAGETAVGDDGEAETKSGAPKLPRVYFGIKIGIR